MNKFDTYPSNVLFRARFNYYIEKPINCADPDPEITRRLEHFVDKVFTEDKKRLFYLAFKEGLTNKEIQHEFDRSNEDIERMKNYVLKDLCHREPVEYITGQRMVDYRDYGDIYDHHDTSWPRGLLKEIGINEYFFENLDYNNLTQDQLDGLEYAISQLSDYEQKYIDLRYKQHMTYKAAAEVADISTARIKYHISRACFKLRQPYLRIFIIDGISSSGYNTSQKNSSPVTLVHNSELSTHAKNCLIRRGYGTIDSVVEYVSTTDNWYEKLRGCGKKTAREIMKYLEARGLVDRSNRGWAGIEQWDGDDQVNEVVDMIKKYNLDSLQLTRVKAHINDMLSGKE